MKNGTHYTHPQNIFVFCPPRYGSYFSFFLGCCMIIKYQHEVKERSKQRQKCTEKNQIYIHIYQPEEETANFRNFTKKQIINTYNTYRHTCNVYVNIYTYIKDTRRIRTGIYCDIVIYCGPG